MEICDFSSAASLVFSFVSESAALTQAEFMSDLFATFAESEEGCELDFDSGRVHRWLRGTEKLSPLVIRFYADGVNRKYLAKDIEEYILPLLYDVDAAAKGLYDLVIADSSVSESRKRSMIGDYPYENEYDTAAFFCRVLTFGMERTFIKRDSKTGALKTVGALSPLVRDYVFTAPVPKPCRHFCGRERELEELNGSLQRNGRVFVGGVAGIGKSELAKMYAKRYRKEYTNILYFNYSGSLKEMIAECEFADDQSGESDEVRFKRHSRFLRTLKEDTLIIIDNFNTTASEDSFFDVLMEYRCRLLFTTRSCFDEYCSYELAEMDKDDLMKLITFFCPEAERYREITEQIINEVHRHTLSVELAARLLSVGIMEPDMLLDELRHTKAILQTPDKVRIVKDGRTTKATYYDHIHKLISLFGLSEQAISVMRNMVFIPDEGIRPKLFAAWTSLGDMNTVNDLVEYGFIRKDELRSISLHPLVRDITVDDTSPSVTNCMTMIGNIHELCLNHGLDLNYHRLMFRTVENIIHLAEKNDTDVYLLFIKDAFAGMEKYAYSRGMQLILSELEGHCRTAEDKALLLDYKAAYEYLCRRNNKQALRFEQFAAKYVDEIENINPQLAANICDNTGALYHSAGDLERAKQYIEKMYSIIAAHKLPVTNDSLIQARNYANLAASMGEPERAVGIMEKCAKAVSEYNSYMSCDYADLIWDMAAIYMRTGKFMDAAKKYREAIAIYNVVLADEPLLLKQKENELRNTWMLHDALTSAALLRQK